MARKTRNQALFRRDTPSIRRVLADTCADWGRRGAPARRAADVAPCLDDLIALLRILSRAKRARAAERHSRLRGEGIVAPRDGTAKPQGFQQ
jgi:hypothetical protein